MLGQTHYTVGLINGGVAPNVVSPSAEAEVMFRTVERRRRGARAVAPLERRVAIEHVLEVPPVRLKTVPGFETAVFPYTTDIPFLTAWGAAAALRSRIDSRRAHRRRVRVDRRAEGRRRPLRARSRRRSSDSPAAYSELAKESAWTTKTRKHEDARRRYLGTTSRLSDRPAARSKLFQKISALTTKARRHEGARRRHWVVRPLFGSM